MQPNSSVGHELRQQLQQGAQALGVGMTGDQCDALLAYLALLLKWNAVYNLTAVRRPAEALNHHLLDSLSTLPPLWRHLGGRAARVLDVGSGGGLPGVVLAIMEPLLSVTCVDAVGKKASFVQQVASELRLRNLQAVHARVEVLEAEPFDIITSRAFASLLDFTQLSGALLAPQGVWMAMKGKPPQDEIAVLSAALNVFHVEQLTVPSLPAARCLVWMRPAQIQQGGA